MQMCCLDPGHIGRLLYCVWTARFRHSSSLIDEINCSDERPHQTCPAGVDSVRWLRWGSVGVFFWKKVGQVWTEGWSGVIVQRDRVISKPSDDQKHHGTLRSEKAARFTMLRGIGKNYLICNAPRRRWPTAR